MSRDGQLLAYASNESGQYEVYALPLSDPSRRVQVSRGGGTQPVWSPDGRHLFFRSSDRMMRAAVRRDGRLTVERVEPLVRRREVAGVAAVRLGDRARGRGHPRRPVVRLAVVVAGQPEAEQERNDDHRRGEEPRQLGQQAAEVRRVRHTGDLFDQFFDKLFSELAAVDTLLPTRQLADGTVWFYEV